MVPISVNSSKNNTQTETLLGNLNKIINSKRKTMRGKERKHQDDQEISLVELAGKLTKLTEPVGEILGLSHIQCIIFAAMIEECCRYRFDLSNIANEIGISYIQLISFNEDIEDLKKKGFIKIDKDKNISVPKPVINALAKNTPYHKPATTGLNTITMMRRFNDIFSDISSDILDDEDAIAELDKLVMDNPDTAYSKTCKELKIMSYKNIERQLFYGLSNLFYSDDDDKIMWSQVAELFSQEDSYDLIKFNAAREELGLMKKGIVEYTSDSGIKSKDEIHICDDIKRRIFADAGTFTGRKQQIAGTIECKSIAPKELFYEKHEADQVATLERMLTEEGYKSVCEALKKKNLRTGLTVLMHGAPGTGKTSCVYELARRTGRDIIIADVSKIKNCYVGETEKNIKALFDDYKRSVNEDGRPKILLFNEADAIFGVRKEGATDAVDKMEGSLQNIILQGMEDLEGILIATTNLTGSLDKAFMRRFLYKIEFSRPSAACKKKIWKSMLPELSDAQALELAEEYETFTGGNIENICRKKMIQSIIDGVEPNFEDIKSFCDDEIIGAKANVKKIGF